MKAVLNRALRLVRRTVDEGRACIHRLEPSPPTGSSLERTVAKLLGDMTTGRGSATSNLRPGRAADAEPGNPAATLSDRARSGDERITSFRSDKDRG